MMKIPESSHVRTGFPFRASRCQYRLLLQAIPTEDLLIEIEAARWLALDLAAMPGDSRAVCEIQLEEMVTELERRRRLYESRTSDPHRPDWPVRDRSVQLRIEKIKAKWPIRRFLEELLLVNDLRRTGHDRWSCRCPLPGHEDRTPSFVVYEDTNSAYCFGCERGGDVVRLTQYTLKLSRPYAALSALERVGNGGLAGEL